MKLLAIVPAAFLLWSSGCGSYRPKSSSVSEEVRHPSNEMNPPELEPAPENKEVQKLATAKRPPARPPRRAGYEDPRQISSGIEYSEMVRRFGPPSMKITDSPSRTTFSYTTRQTQVQVEVQNGKVVSVAAVNTGF